MKKRLAASTWGQHMSVLSLFYQWAMEDGHAEAEPFTYRMARALFAGTGREVRVNLAVRRTPKPHVTCPLPTVVSPQSCLRPGVLRGVHVRHGQIKSSARKRQEHGGLRRSAFSGHE